MLFGKLCDSNRIMLPILKKLMNQPWIVYLFLFSTENFDSIDSWSYRFRFQLKPSIIYLFLFPQKISTALIREDINRSIKPSIMYLFLFSTENFDSIDSWSYRIRFQLKPSIIYLFLFSTEISTALIRNHTVLCFSIAGGRRSIPFIYLFLFSTENFDSVASWSYRFRFQHNRRKRVNTIQMQWPDL